MRTPSVWRSAGSGYEMASRRRTYLPARIGWNNWGGIFTDVALWRPVVAAICHEHGLAANGIEAGFPGSCAVFTVGDKAVVKIFPPLFPQDYQKERDVYWLLGDRLSFMPRLLGQGVYQDRIDWPYLILEYREGEPIREVFSEINQENRASLGRALGRAIRTIHGTPLDRARHFQVDPEAWRAFLRQRLQSCLGELHRETPLPKSVLREVKPFLDSQTLLPGHFNPMLLNGDLTEDHLLLIRQKGEWHISALIDWADAEVGTAEYEWVALWFGLCQRHAGMFRQILQAYNPQLDLGQTFRRRMMAFTFLHRFGSKIIAHALQQDGPPPIRSLPELMDRLWPPL